MGLWEEAGLLDRGMEGDRADQEVSTCYSQTPQTFPDSYGGQGLGCEKVLSLPGLGTGEHRMALCRSARRTDGEAATGQPPSPLPGFVFEHSAWDKDSHTSQL